jgi:hypothetical protein
MTRILYISNKNDVFLNAFNRHLDLNYFHIQVLSLAHGELININTGKTFQILKIKDSYPHAVRYSLRYFCSFLFILHQRRLEFDVIHILNIKRENFFLIPFLRKKCKKIIITVYGRSTYLYPTKRFLFSRVYKFVDIFVFSNTSVIKEFSTFHEDVPSDKLIENIPPLDSISLNSNYDKSDSILKFCSENHIDNKLIKVSCSSTIHSYEQHYKVIEALKNLKRKENILLMFLLTYGGTEEEQNNIIIKIKQDLSDFNVCIITTFLTNTGIAAYRALTDIYINMRTSDQMAGAILESLNEGAMLISADWLKYDALDKLGIYYKKVNGFNELVGIIDESIEELDKYKKEHACRNADKIKEAFSVDVVMKKWAALYCRISV